MDAYLERARQLIDTRLPLAFAELNWHSQLRDYSSYVMLGSGKAIRPALFLWSFAEFHSETVEDFEFLPDWALAIEMLHTYSLVHDDLPAMDNDDFRRGKPTLHKLHGDAAAILTGDALLTGSFEMLARKAPRDARGLEAVRVLARASGAAGMISGQWRDMSEASETDIDHNLKALERVHREKTGALIGAAMELGAIAAFANSKTCHLLRHWGVKAGLLFQVVDDLLDATQTFEKLGKTPGKDHHSNKRSYVSLLGLDGCTEKIENLRSELIDEAEGLLDEQGALALVDFISRRKT
jgi:geranylgeranyl diphosphate synthase type II